MCVIFCSGSPGCFKIAHIICPDWWFDNTSTASWLFLRDTTVSKLVIGNFKGFPCSNSLFPVFTFFNVIWLWDFNEIHFVVGSHWWVELSKVSLCISGDQSSSWRSQGAAPDQQDLIWTELISVMRCVSGVLMRCVCLCVLEQMFLYLSSCVCLCDHSSPQTLKTALSIVEGWKGLNSTPLVLQFN